MAHSNAKIVIVGCGISGVSAAVKLFKQGFRDIHIVEATGRSGGRIRTTTFGDDILELGAGWIQGPSQENPVFRLACQYDLLDPESMTKKNQEVDLRGELAYSPLFLCSSGKSVRSKSLLPAMELFGGMLEQCRSIGAGNHGSQTPPVPSMGEYIKAELPGLAEKKWSGKKGPDAEARKLSTAVWSAFMKSECCMQANHSLDEISLEMYGLFKILPGLDCPFPKGYNGLIDCLLRELPEDVVSYNTPVHCIHWSDDSSADDAHTHPVRVECANGKVFPADHVIVTVPLGYLKKHHATLLSPPLPQHKLDSVQRVNFGTVNKIFLEFEKPFWKADTDIIALLWDDETSMTDTVADVQTQWERKLFGFSVVNFPENAWSMIKFMTLGSSNKSHILCGWIAGHEAEYMESLPETEVLNTMTKVLRRFTGDSTVTPTKILRTQWSQDVYTCGSYSSHSVGCTAQDIQNLAEPLPSGDSKHSKPLQVLFAGEATHECFFATVHGGLLSGWREADRLITHCSSKK